MRSFIRTILWIAFIGALGYMLLNADYFYKQIRYIVVKPKVEQRQADTLNGNVDTPAVPQLEPNMISIPSLGISAPIVESTEAMEAAYQVALMKGIVHYPGTANVGQPGNAYLFGHSSDYPWTEGHYKTVFALLPSIAMNDEIFVSDADGKVYRYYVIDKKVVNNDDIAVLEQGNREQFYLTLQTSYPVGTALKRYIVKAVLDQLNPQ